MRVIDKRMFTADGELREEVREELARLEDARAQAPAVEPAPKDVPAEPPPPAAAPSAPPAAEPVDADAPTDPHFARLVMMISQQAGLYLGLMVDPLNPGGTVDLPLAKSLIDMLASLDRKTRGRLNAEEGQLLESVLYELQMAYVERSRRNPRG